MILRRHSRTGGREMPRPFASLLEFFIDEWSLSIKAIFAAEWGVFAALRFSLHARSSHVAFHFKRLMKSLEWLPLDYLGSEMYDQWQEALKEEFAHHGLKQQKKGMKQKQKEKKLMKLERELQKQQKKADDRTSSSLYLSNHSDSVGFGQPYNVELTDQYSTNKKSPNCDSGGEVLLKQDKVSSKNAKGLLNLIGIMKSPSFKGDFQKDYEKSLSMAESNGQNEMYRSTSSPNITGIDHRIISGRNDRRRSMQNISFGDKMNPKRSLDDSVLI